MAVTYMDVATKYFSKYLLLGSPNLHFVSTAVIKQHDKWEVLLSFSTPAQNIAGLIIL